MKLYIEAIEDKDLSDTMVRAHFVKEEVKKDSKSEFSLTNIKNTKNTVKSKLQNGKVYKYRKHFCHHDEKVNKPCTVETIEVL